MESIMFRIMNVKALHQLEDEIEQMEDAQEREIRTQLIEQIIEKITDYDVHVREYAYKQSIKNLLDRGIVIEPVEKAPIIDLWDQQIDSLVSIETKHATQHYSDDDNNHYTPGQQAMQKTHVTLAIYISDKETGEHSSLIPEISLEGEAQ